MSKSPQPLTFSELDGLGFAAERGRFDPSAASYVADDLGPVFELGLLAKSKTTPWPGASSWLAMDGIAPLITALSNRSHHWVCPTSRAAGVYRTYATPEEDDLHWVQFGVAIRSAAVSAGFSRNVAAQLVGAIGEMQSNIYEHSQASQTGIVAFRGRSGTFEFVVCDVASVFFRASPVALNSRESPITERHFSLPCLTAFRVTGEPAGEAWAFSRYSLGSPTSTALCASDPAIMP